jgi:hypothetical protein
MNILAQNVIIPFARPKLYNLPFLIPKYVLFYTANGDIVRLEIPVFRGFYNEIITETDYRCNVPFAYDSLLRFDFFCG